MSGEPAGEHGAWIAAALAAALLLAVVWTTGALAGLLFGPGPATTAPSASLAVALRLPSHLADPRAAWPPPARGELPDAAGVYAAGAIVMALTATLAALATGLARRLGLPSLTRRRERPPAARWARRSDLAALRIRSPQAGRLTLGRHGRDLIAAEPGQSAIVFGPTQTHKTSGLAIPALLEWRGPVLCTSVKSDLLAHTLARREALGETWVLDPARVTEVERSRADPLARVGGWEDALRLAHWFAAGAKPGTGDLRDGDFWLRTAEKLLAPLLLAAADSGLTMAGVTAWLDRGPEAIEEEVTAILREAGRTEAGRAFAASQNREERQRSSVYTTAETILAAFADPVVAEETSGADYAPEALLEGPNTLYLVGPGREQERLRIVFATLIQELLALVEERATRGEGPIEPRLLLLLDECANVAPLPGLDEIASTAAGLGVQLLTVFQDMAQVKARYGPRAATIANNHRAKLLTRGVSDPDTLRYFTDLIGIGEFGQRSTSTSRGERSRSSHTEGETWRELAPAHLLRQGREAEAMLVYGSAAPGWIGLRPWYEDPCLRELAWRGYDLAGGRGRRVPIPYSGRLPPGPRGPDGASTVDRWRRRRGPQPGP